MSKSNPISHLLNSFIIGCILYIVFRFIFLFSDHLSQISSISIAALCCVYLIVVYEIKDIVNKRSQLLNNFTNNSSNF